MQTSGFVSSRVLAFMYEEEVIFCNSFEINELHFCT